MKKVFLPYLFFITLTTFGQASRMKFGDIPREDMRMTVYPGDPSASAVVLVDYGKSSIDYNHPTGFQVNFERLRRVKILSKEGLEWAELSILLYHDSDRAEKMSGLKVVTYNLVNGEIVGTKAKNESFFEEKYDANRNITKIAWPAVKQGSILEIAYHITSDFIFNFQGWQFQQTIPTRISEYQANIPQYFNYEKYMQGYVALSASEREMQTGSFEITNRHQRSRGYIPTSSLTFAQQKVDYQIEHFRWVATDIPAFRREPFMTASIDYISKINFELAYTNFTVDFANPGIKRYMGTWENINSTYWEKVGDLISGSNSLKNEVDGVTAGLTTADQKVAAIIKLLKQRVLWDETYSAYPLKSPKKTWEEKKGSSAEINFLLACMLEKAEILAHPVLLSTRDHGFVRELMPLYSQFNSAVCLVRLGDKPVLLDATDKFLPIGLLPEQCLNGQGLAVSKEGFQWVSLQPTVKTKIVSDTDLSLTESGELTGSLKIEKTGYNSVEARKSFITNGEKAYLKSFNNHSMTLHKSEFQNVNEIQQPFKEIHEIELREHTTGANNTIYLNPFILARAEENPFKQKKRVYPVDFGHAFEETYVAKIAVPENFVVDELPKGKVMALPGNAAKYTYSVSQIGNVIHFASNLNMNKSLFVQDEYPNLREFYSLMVAKQAEQIVLKKK